MTIPAFTGLQTALRGLEANQAGINTTGNNIANANTPGYTRETPDFTESTDLTLTAFSNVTGAGVQLGTGVDVTTINRIRDQFLDIQYRAQNSASSNAQTNASELGDVQTAVDEPSTDGISAALSNFWSAWSQLAQSPTGTSSAAAKQSVIETGQTLAQTFNTVDAQMASVQSQAQQQYNTLTAAGGQVSQYANQIASLNTEISQATQAGQEPNDLLDQRDQLLDELSGMAQVSVTDNSDGTVTVGFGGAASPLVSGSTVNWPQTLGSSPGGQLGALSSLAGATGEIQTLRTALNGVANDVVTAVNGLQPSSTPFFSGNSAASIAVAATASTLTASSSSGSGDVAGSEAALSGGTADQAFSAFVGQLGNAVSSAQSTASTASSVLSAIDNQRQSVSGVSLDEEMTNLITYQQGYQASARMMTTIDTVLNTLINSTGAGL